MIGDVNLFLNDPYDRHSAEIEVMIAEPEARRNGHATLALSAIMQLGVTHLNIKTYIAKISFENMSSITLFLTKFVFKEVSRSEVFKEVTLHRHVDAEFMILLEGLSSIAIKTDVL
jgi:hypothetical protein